MIISSVECTENATKPMFLGSSISNSPNAFQNPRLGATECSNTIADDCPWLSVVDCDGSAIAYLNQNGCNPWWAFQPYYKYQGCCPGMHCDCSCGPNCNCNLNEDQNQCIENDWSQWQDEGPWTVWDNGGNYNSNFGVQFILLSEI